MSTTPRVSVIIPVFDGEWFLQDAVESVVGQTWREWEVFIVDDGSRDGSGEIADELAEANPGRVTVLKNDRNRGVSYSRNRACRLARGDLLAFLDVDDLWHPEKLTRQVAVFDADERREIGMVHTGTEVFASARDEAWLAGAGAQVTEIAHWQREFNEVTKERLAATGHDYLAVLQTGSPICLSSAMVRKDLFTRSGGFEEGLYYQVEDWLLWWKLALMTRMRFLQERLTLYRVHPQSYTSRVLIQKPYSHEIVARQIRDRGVAFARRAGIPVGYSDLPGRRSVRTRLKEGLRQSGRSLAWKAGQVGSRLRGRISHGNRTGAGEDVDGGLSQLILFVTSACNLSCSHCFYAGNLNRKGELTLAEIEALAKSCGRRASVLLTGGEPFLRPDLGEILDVFLSRGQAALGVNTNGFDPKTIETTVRKVLDRYPHATLEVSVSLDGFEQTHNRIRRHGRAYTLALDSLRVLNELGMEYPGLHPGINTVLTAGNLDEVVELGFEMAEGFELDHHNFEIERPSALPMRRWPGSRDQLTRTYSQLLLLVQRRYPGDFQTTREQFAIQMANALDGAPWRFPCLAGQRSAVVHPDGTLAACELRNPIIPLREIGFSLPRALTAAALRDEISDIARGGCFCTHGCWLLISLQDHLARTYGVQDGGIALRQLPVVRTLGRVPGGRRVSQQVARTISRPQDLLARYRRSFSRH
jgi:glycosyltransferase involved in cell wall biosynthesis/MoaA/NifB/PqqE/SkfB family radical SAM enzyme